MSTVSTSGYCIEDLKPGMVATMESEVTEQMVQAFADLSGDHNPVHLDEQFAAKTPFKGRIAHGMLSASFISAVLGTQLPGPGSIYVSQQLRFMAPVHLGALVKTQVTVTRVDEARRRVYLETVCMVSDSPVLQGEAELMVPRHPRSV